MLKELNRGNSPRNTHTEYHHLKENNLKALRKYQQEAIDAVNRGLNRPKPLVNQMLVLATGCHAINTPILMYNGTIKMVQDIVVGDELMGDDNTSRTVNELVRGTDLMYKIIPTKGDAFIVNQHHILSLKRTGANRDGRNNPDFIEITVKDYIEKHNHFKHLYKLYRVSAEFQNIGAPTDPYWIGLWLGDGTVGRPQITTPDIEIRQWATTEFMKFCSWNHPEININVVQPKDKCLHIDFTKTNHQPKSENSLLKIIRELFVKNEKRISDRLLRTSRENRLQLLAGLLDADGYLHNNCYEIITKYNGLSEDILFLCRSLGLAAYKSKKTGTIKKLNFSGEYWRIVISGQTSMIPCKVKRKQAEKRSQKKDALVTGFKLEKLSNDSYYGFKISGNHLYCMGDFTVTHNCGKTFTAIKAISPFKKRLWITHTEELLEQSGVAALKELDPKIDIQTMIDTHGGLSEYLRSVKNHGLFSDMSENDILKNIGIVKAEAFDIEADIVFASAQTLHRRLHKMSPEMFDAIVPDECHLFMADSFVKSLNYFQPKLKLGLTATPNRADGRSLADVFDEIVYQYNIADAIKDGYLCELDALQIQSKLSLDKVRTLGGEFNQKDLSETVDNDERNSLLLTKYRQYANGKQNIIFCVDVEHAKNVHRIFTDAGEKAEVLVGDTNVTPDRKGTINRFKAGQTTHLINVMIATAGFDHPNIGCITLACPTKSLTKFMQQIGRGTRTLPGVIDRIEDATARIQSIKKSAKPHCTVLDIVDTTNKHQIINTWSLERELPLEERVFMTTERREASIEARNKRKFQAQTNKDTRVDLLKLPKVTLSNSLKMKDAATEKQILLLKKLGYETEDVFYTKGDANRLISNHSATEKQILVLRKIGYDTRNGVTIAQATLAFEEIKAKAEKAKEQKMTNSILPIQGLD